MASTRGRDALVRRGFSIGGDGLRIPPGWDAVTDVLFDGRRVWSFAPARDAVDADGSRLIRWPVALRPYLDGVACITLREHITGDVLLDREHRFGVVDKRVRVVDRAGRPLALNKLGHLEPTFDAVGPAAAEFLFDRVAEILAVIRDECGVPAFLTAGALLGAVREGKLLGHDCDMDVAYLSRYGHPVDVARESFRVERALHRRGLRHRRFSAADFKVLVTGADGAVHGFDVRAGFWLDGLFYLLPNVRAPLPRSAVLPLGDVELDGRRFPAPADPAAVLEATYGPNWRVPDPSFKFRPPPATRRRLDGWMRGLRPHREHWNTLYGRRRAAAPSEPSPFARWVSQHDPAHRPVVDIGSGDGRDALWFARSGREVRGLDYAVAAVGKARSAAAADDLSATFDVFNLYDLRQVLTAGARLAADGRPKTLYGRLLVDALEDEGRRHLWRLAALALRPGGRLYLEFRTSRDTGDASAERPPAGYVRRLDPDAVAAEIEGRGGRVEHREKGHGTGLSDESDDEDPHICRLVASWRR